MWDRDIYHLFMAEPRFSLEHTTTSLWQGTPFRTLPEEEAFLIQVTHAFHHILSCWIRMSWLYEIAYFLNQRAYDSALWGRIEKRVGNEPQQREIIAVVSAMAGQFFGAPLPPVVGGWDQALRPAVRVWVENYARKWAFGKSQLHESGLFPTAKLALFLHREYASDPATRRRLTRARLLPSKKLVDRLGQAAPLLRSNPGAIQEIQSRQWKKAVVRFAFHVTSGLRYLCETPRWWWLNRVARRSRSNRQGSGTADPVNVQSPRATVQM